jgi:preprotein translocase subunit YajC
MYAFVLPFFSRPLWNIIAVVLIAALIAFVFQRRRRKKAMDHWEEQERKELPK